MKIAHEVMRLNNAGVTSSRSSPSGIDLGIEMSFTAPGHCDAMTMAIDVTAQTIVCAPVIMRNRGNHWLAVAFECLLRLIKI